MTLLSYDYAQDDGIEIAEPTTTPERILALLEPGPATLTTFPGSKIQPSSALSRWLHFAYLITGRDLATGTFSPAPVPAPIVEKKEEEERLASHPWADEALRRQRAAPIPARPPCTSYRDYRTITK